MITPGPGPGLYRQLTRRADPAAIALDMPRADLADAGPGHDQGESRAPWTRRPHVSNVDAG